MPTFEIIPAIDLLNGQVVRLTQGDYAQVDTYPHSPVELARRFESAGAKKIHIVDLNGAKDGKPVNIDTVKAIRNAVSCELDLGGGIRTPDTAKMWLDTGIDYIVLGSAFIKTPNLSRQIVRKYPNKIIAGLDAKQGKIATEGWTESSALSVATFLTGWKDDPLAYVIYTDIEKDGMLNGPNLDAMQQVAEASPFPVVASGGVRNKEDIQMLRDLHPPLKGCIIGKAIYADALDWTALWL